MLEPSQTSKINNSKKLKQIKTRNTPSLEKETNKYSIFRYYALKHSS